MTLNDIPSPTLTSNHADGGKVKGQSSGATGYVFGSLTSGTTIVLTNVSGTFQGEKITVSDSAETDQIVENAANTDLTISEVVTHTFSETRSIFGDDNDSIQDFTADVVLERTTTGADGQIVMNATDANGTDENDNIVLKKTIQQLLH